MHTADAPATAGDTITGDAATAADYDNVRALPLAEVVPPTSGDTRADDDTATNLRVPGFLAAFDAAVAARRSERPVA